MNLSGQPEMSAPVSHILRVYWEAVVKVAGKMLSCSREASQTLWSCTDLF